jgi:hypothetical protein
MNFTLEINFSLSVKTGDKVITKLSEKLYLAGFTFTQHLSFSPLNLREEKVLVSFKVFDIELEQLTTVQKIFKSHK